MTVEQILMTSLDAEIEKYEKAILHYPEPAFSEKHNKLMKDAVRIATATTENSNNYERITPIHLNVKRMVVVVLVAALIMVFSAVAIGAIHPEYYMIIKEKVKEWTINFRTKEESVSQEFRVNKLKTPKGFSLINEEIEDGMYSANYNSTEDKEIIYVQQEISETTITGLDSENDYKKIKTLDGRKTIVMKKGTCYTLFWVHDSCSYTLVGNCELNQLMTIAKTLE